MGDSINALLQGQRANTVLQGIANPAVVNPLAAITAGNQAAQAEYKTRELQANQALGQILQQSTDENGNVDFQDAQRRAALAGPIVQAGMQSYLTNNAQLRGAQIKQATDLHNFVADLAASGVNDPSLENIARLKAEGKSYGLPDAGTAELDRIAAITDPEQRRTEFYKHLQSRLDTVRQLSTTPYGLPTLQDTGGQIQQLQNRAPTPWSPGGVGQGGAVTTHADPNTVLGMPDVVYPATQEDVQAGRASSVGQPVHVSGADRTTRFGLGGLLPPGAREVPGTGGSGGGGNRPAVVRDSSGKPVGPANPPRLLNVPGQTPPASQTGSPAPPAPVGTNPNAPVVIPPPPVPPPAPTVAPTAPVAPVHPNTNGVPTAPTTMGPLQGGVQVASANPLQVPVTGTPGPPSPLVPADVALIQQGMAQARATPRVPGTQVAGATMSVGPGYDEKVMAETSQERLAADSKMAANYASNIFPHTQALAALGRGVTTGPTTDQANTMKGWAGAVARSLGFNGVFDSTKNYDELHKWLSQITTNNPIAQGSDARLAATMAGNARTDIHELASADMMKTGIALMRMNATAQDEWLSNPDVRAKYGYYNNYLRDFNKTVDPRAFAWDMYNDTQKKDLAADIQAHRNDPTYAAKLKASLDLVRKHGYMGEMRAMP